MKFFVGANDPSLGKSRPARGAWVEISGTCAVVADAPVAPRKGRVG